MKHIPHIFINTPLIAGALIKLPEEKIHHLRNVMRLTDDAPVCVFNENDGRFVGKLVWHNKTSAHVRVTECVHPPQNHPKIWVFYPPLKPEPLRFLIEKGTELGVTDFAPFLSAYGQNRHVKKEKIETWVIQAAEQSQGLHCPTVHEEILLLTDILSQFSGSLLIAGHLKESRSLTEFAHQWKSAQPVGIIVGPEGGWSPHEEEILARLPGDTGRFLLSLGTQILRSETAAITLLVMAKFLGAREEERAKM